MGLEVLVPVNVNITTCCRVGGHLHVVYRTTRRHFSDDRTQNKIQISVPLSAAVLSEVLARHLAKCLQCVIIVHH
jgi:hypothetical protein